MLDTIRGVFEVLRLRAAGHAGHRIYRRARQVPARPGPAQRGRVLLQGRRRAMAVAALRPDRAARPLRRREFPEPAQALPPLSGRAGVAEREAGPRPLPPVHPVRRRHGRRFVRRRRRRALHARRRHARGARRRARAIRHQGQQPQSARWSAGGHRSRRRRQCQQAPHCAARHRQARPAWDREGVRALLGKGRKDESGDFTKGAGLRSPSQIEIAHRCVDYAIVDLGSMPRMRKVTTQNV